MSKVKNMVHGSPPTMPCVIFSFANVLIFFFLIVRFLEYRMASGISIKGLVGLVAEARWI